MMMKFLILLSIAMSSLFSSAYSVAQETAKTQADIKNVINEQTEVTKKIKSLYIEDVVSTKKIVFNSEILIKIKAEEKK